MSNTKIGWYHIKESFEADGIDIAVRDRRTNELVAFKLKSLEEYDALIEFLDENRRVGTLSQLKAAASGD